ncbi:MAG TPA: zeta toxin family protein [Rhabdochlamydiaceae bacterium]|jgi:predicted ABC-type ATPase|nr:zeta toxin family protein [Rhabdochlamydiaceae bacterium]
MKKLFYVIVFTAALQAEGHFFFSPQQIEKHLVSYNEQEKEEIANDLAVVRSVCRVKEAPSKKQPFYLATAGGPGARKSTILERFIQRNPEFQSGVYLDPDHRGLKFMSHTYYNLSLNALMAASNPDYLEVRKAAYEKWREASNYITLVLLEEALQKKSDIIHGTTLTGDYVTEFLKKLKAAGSHITLVLCYCEDQIRKEAIEYRNNEQRFYQSTPEEEMSKGKAFVEKLSVYFEYADTLHLYWSDDLLAEERNAVIFDKGKMIINEGCGCVLARFVTQYEEDRKALLAEGKMVPDWEELFLLYLGRF